MSNAGYNVIDTRSFDAVMNIRAELIQDYDRINNDYDRIISTLNADWKGRGAEAFVSDAAKIKSNITGIQNILKEMCDTLHDCREIIGMADSQIGEANANPESVAE